MAEFLVLYEEPRLVVMHDRSFYEPQGHALVVQASNETQAFIAAYDHLTRRGHMVRTMKAGESLENLQRFAQQRRAYSGTLQIVVVAGLDIEHMEEVYQAGVPIVGGKNDDCMMTDIISIQPYQVRRTGAVVSED
ncbi:MAG: hypothetical protein HC884_18105 [Chloroflexaceae bacterium]|nr:hypothetical protein [Chloroflexaceae bacterium]